MKTKHNTRLLGLILILALTALACQASFDLPGLDDPVVDEAATTEAIEQANPTNPPQTPQPTLSSSGSSDFDSNVEILSQQDALIALYENVNPGVVALFVVGDLGAGAGTGFVIDLDGHIVTNYHVVEDATDIQVTFPTGIKTRAEVVGIDTDSDLAVVKVEVDPAELHPLTLGDSDQLKVGQIVVAIGNPFGFSGTMTTGIVSGLGRSLSGLNASPTGQFFSAGDIIQTDAAINPGNSGGPLLNLNGEVIGINRAIQTFNQNSENEPINSGIGFAVSVNILKRVVPSLIADGFYNYPYLGISSPEEISLSAAEQLGLEKAVGVLIGSVTEGGPANTAGLKVGDVILALNGQDVLNFGDLISYLFTKTAPGDIVEFTVWREGETLVIPVEIGARP